MSRSFNAVQVSEREQSEVVATSSSSDSDADVGYSLEPHYHGRFRKLASAAGAAVLLCGGAGACAGALSHHGPGHALPGRGEGAVSTESVLFVKPGTNCSDVMEDCREAGCCKTSGFTCMEKDSESAWCKLECPAGKGWTCTDLTKGRMMEVKSQT